MEEEIRRAGYSKRSNSERKSILIFKTYLDENQVYPYVNENDKTPNHDGYLDLMERGTGQQLGELMVQVKTLDPKKTDPPRFSLEYGLFDFVLKATVNPFLLIGVDQAQAKVYWLHLTKEEARAKIENWKGNDTVTVHFPPQNEIRENEPYEDWIEIVENNLSVLSGDTPPLICEIPLDTTQEYLDQIHGFFQTLYHEIEFVPLSILTRINPVFRLPSLERIYSSWSLLELRTNNENFFHLIEEGTTRLSEENPSWTEADQVKNDKLKDIFTWLRKNIVYNIRCGSKVIEVYQDDEGKACDCVNCLISRSEFEKASKELHSKTTNLSELMQLAYANYQLENYVQSAEQFLIARDIAYNESKMFARFVIHYNLSKLARLLRFRINPKDKYQQKLMSKLEAVDLNKEYKLFGTAIYFPVVDYLYRERFMNIAHQKIKSTNEDIKRQYQYAKYRGEMTHNGYVRQIKSEMLNIEHFVQRNFIVYNKFDDYKELVNSYAEGLYISHATRKRDPDSLQKYDLWSLKVLINYADDKHLRFVYNTYKLKELILENNDEFAEFVSNLFDRFFNLSKNDLGLLGEENSLLSGNYRKSIRNALVVCSQCVLEKKDRQLITQKVFQYIIDYGEYQDLIPFSYYLNRCNDGIPKALLKKALFATIRNERLHHDDYFVSVCEYLINSNRFLKLTTKEFDQIKTFVFDRMKERDQTHEMLYFVWIVQVVDHSEQKKEIYAIIINQLEQKFDFNLFYLAIIYDVIEMRDSFLKEAIQGAKPRFVKTEKMRSYFQGEPWERYRQLDDLINLCFKESIDLKSKLFDSLRGINDYYDWLLDMDGFDYEKFDPVWINTYTTRFYFKKMYDSGVLKGKLEEFLTSTDSFYGEDTTSNYLNIYVRKRWDLNP